MEPKMKSSHPPQRVEVEIPKVRNDVELDSESDEDEINWSVPDWKWIKAAAHEMLPLQTVHEKVWEK